MASASQRVVGTRALAEMRTVKGTCGAGSADLILYFALEILFP